VNLLTTAVEYALLGWPVFPTHWMHGGACSCGHACSSPGKHPLTRNGLHAATTEVDTVSGWWQHTPRANIGLATGQLYVVDLDGADGIAAWDALEIAHGDAPTLMARTGGGGVHRYYRMPPGADLPNTAGRLATKVDTRGAGGYVLAPPSNHKSGHCYEWLNRLNPAPLPAWVVEQLKPRMPKQPPAPATPADHEGTPYGIAMLNNALVRIGSAPEGERNTTLCYEAFIVGQYVAGGEIAMGSDLEDVLVAACPDDDLRKSRDTVRRALQEAWQFPRRHQDDRRT
jgi:hypothetical protein